MEGVTSESWLFFFVKPLILHKLTTEDWPGNYQHFWENRQELFGCMELDMNRWSPEFRKKDIFCRENGEKPSWVNRSLNWTSDTLPDAMDLDLDIPSGCTTTQTIVDFGTITIFHVVYRATDQIGPLASLLYTQVWEANGLSKCRRTLGINTPHSLRPSWTDSSSVQESCCVKLSVTLMTDWRHLEQMEKPKRNVPGNSTGSKWLSYASFVCRG